MRPGPTETELFRANNAPGSEEEARYLALVPMKRFVARFLQGMSGGAMLICQIAVLSHQFREGRERIAAGTVMSPEQNVSGAIIHQALVDGFGWVLLYGGIDVWALAGISFLIFGSGKSAHASDGRSRPEEESSAV